MKLLYIVNARIPTEKAHGYQISKMGEEFSDLGIEVELWAPKRKNPIKDDLFSYYKIKKNFRVRYINSPDFIQYDKYLGKYGCYLQQLLFLINLFFKKANKEKIIYSRNPEIAWLFGLRGYKTVFEAHGWPENKNKFLKICFKKISLVITVTEELKRKILIQGYPENKILVAHDAVDLNIFDININKEKAREKIGLPQDKVIIGYTGSLKTMGRDKGILDIFKAIKILNNNKIIFVAVGGSELDIGYYRKKAKELEVVNNVKFVRRVDLNKLALYQKAFDILLMPFPNIPHYASNMSPLKMFEYLAAKRPIITSDLPSVREVLNEKNCILCKPDDPDDLAEKINYILGNNNVAKKITEEAYREARNYSWSMRTEKIIKFIS